MKEAESRRDYTTQCAHPASVALAFTPSVVLRIRIDQSVGQYPLRSGIQLVTETVEALYPLRSVQSLAIRIDLRLGIIIYLLYRSCYTNMKAIKSVQ